MNSCPGHISTTNQKKIMYKNIYLGGKRHFWQHIKIEWMSRTASQLSQSIRGVKIYCVTIYRNTNKQ